MPLSTAAHPPAVTTSFQKSAPSIRGIAVGTSRQFTRLKITGRRLDSAGNAAPYIEGPNNAVLAKEFTVMMNIIVFPERGCWQLEGNYDGDYLAFVVWVS